MSKIILLAETGADIPVDVVEKYGIRIVPMHVAFGGETRDDGSFPVQDIYDFYEKTGTLTKTSGCVPEDFTLALEKLYREEPDAHILYLAYSAVTTCSYQSAVIASEGMENITMLDTKMVSAGQAMVVLQVARWLDANPGCTVEQAVEYAKSVIEKARMGFFPGDLAYLRAGGRVSNAAYLGAKILSLNPLIELLDGHLKATKKYRGKMEKVAPKFIAEYARNLSRELMVFVYSEGLSDTIRSEANALAREMGFREVLWIPTGGVVTTHCGPGGFGICGFAK